MRSIKGLTVCGHSSLSSDCSRNHKALNYTDLPVFIFSVSYKSEESNMWLGDQNQPMTESGPVQVVVRTLKTDEMREEFSPTAGLTGSMRPADWLIFPHKHEPSGFYRLWSRQRDFGEPALRWFTHFPCFKLQ